VGRCPWKAHEDLEEPPWEAGDVTVFAEHGVVGGVGYVEGGTQSVPAEGLDGAAASTGVAVKGRDGFQPEAAEHVSTDSDFEFMGAGKVSRDRSSLGLDREGSSDAVVPQVPLDGRVFAADGELEAHTVEPLTDVSLKGAWLASSKRPEDDLKDTALASEIVVGGEDSEAVREVTSESERISVPDNLGKPAFEGYVPDG
jgi:hypothetical protein